MWERQTKGVSILLYTDDGRFLSDKTKNTRKKKLLYLVCFLVSVQFYLFAHKIQHHKAKRKNRTNVTGEIEMLQDYTMDVPQLIYKTWLKKYKKIIDWKK